MNPIVVWFLGIFVVALFLTWQGWKDEITPFAIGWPITVPFYLLILLFEWARDAGERSREHADEMERLRAAAKAKAEKDLLDADAEVEAILAAQNELIEELRNGYKRKE